MNIDERIMEILAKNTISNDNFKQEAGSKDKLREKEISGVINVIGNHNVVIDFGLWFLPAVFLLFYFLLAR